MPTQTDRDKIKKQQEGDYVTTAGISDAAGEVVKMHSRPYVIARTGSENAATNVAETPGCTIFRKSRIRDIRISSQDAVANDASHYDKVYVYKYTSAGGSKTLIGSWNTATAAQGAITAFASHSLDLVASEVDEVDANSTITYHVGKTGNGQALNEFALSIDAEEI